jgi:hypothetical protein
MRPLRALGKIVHAPWSTGLCGNGCSSIPVARPYRVRYRMSECRGVHGWAGTSNPALRDVRPSLEARPSCASLRSGTYVHPWRQKRPPVAKRSRGWIYGGGVSWSGDRHRAGQVIRCSGKFSACCTNQTKQAGTEQPDCGWYWHRSHGQSG